MKAKIRMSASVLISGISGIKTYPHLTRVIRGMNPVQLDSLLFSFEMRDCEGSFSEYTVAIDR